MLIRMSRARTVAPNGFTVQTLRKGSVYQVPDDLGRGLVHDKDAVAIDANTLKDALPRSHILPGRAAVGAA